MIQKHHYYTLFDFRVEQGIVDFCVPQHNDICSLQYGNKTYSLTMKAKIYSRNFAISIKPATVFYLNLKESELTLTQVNNNSFINIIQFIIIYFTI